MHLSIWKSLSQCAAAIITEKKKKKTKTKTKKSRPEDSHTDSSFELQKLREALEEASENGFLYKLQEICSDPAFNPSHLLPRLNAQLEFLRSTSLAFDQKFNSESTIPNLHESFSKFMAMYPKYNSSEKIDQLRSNEYSNLSPKVCLDYCGFGLFSYVQTVHYWESCTFSLSEITANLSNHALCDGPEIGTIEHDIKTRVMDYLNIPEQEYALVFTVNRGSAFKLVAQSYPFNKHNKLLTMYDYESQSVNWMSQSAREEGAGVYTAWFQWPTLKLCSADLRGQLQKKKKKKKKRRNKDSESGLFVFPVQSRVSGAKYSYLWMAMAQQNDWHVLLDAGSLGPKEMDSLGLSLFRPDFIITSFYRVFGYDPSGFGCLLIKKSMIPSLQIQSGFTSSGIVRISPDYPLYLSDSMDGFDNLTEIKKGEDGIFENLGETSEPRKGSHFPAFSGAYTSSQVRNVFETETGRENGSERDYTSTIFEESESVCFGEIMKSPIFTEDDSSDNSFWIDLGPSPLGSDLSSQLNKLKTASPLPSYWLITGTKKNHKRLSPKTESKIYNSPIYDDEEEICEERCSAEIIQQEIRTVKSGPTGSMSNSVSKQSAITRETEGEEPRMLGRRQGNVGEPGDEQEQDRTESEIICRHLDHANMLGLSKTTIRLRFLINWLVTSLLQLKLPCSDGSRRENNLVEIYGPKLKYERGAAVAFNLRDKNLGLIDPEFVVKLAEREGIFLGFGFLSHIRNLDSMRKNGETGSDCDGKKSGFVRVEVITASLGFLTNFEDVYRLWAFVAKFLNPGFTNNAPEIVDT